MSNTTASLLKSENASALANRSMVFRDGVVGLVARTAVVTAAMGLTLVLLLLVKSQGWFFTDLETSLFWISAAVVWIGMCLGVFFSEYPRGSEAALARVGLATFCRTGLPLLVVLVAVNYATRLVSVASLVGFLYAVGLVVSLGLELSRLGFPQPNSPSE